MGSPVYTSKAHGSIINAIDGIGGLGIGGGAPEIVTGGRDGELEYYQYNFNKINKMLLIGSVKVWDPRQSGTPVAEMSPADGEVKRDCWTVSFGNSYNDEERCVCAGFDNGDIKMFDLRTMSLKWETNIKNGVSKGVWLY